MKKHRVLSLTEGPILSSLIRFTLPILGALFFVGSAIPAPR